MFTLEISAAEDNKLLANHTSDTLTYVFIWTAKLKRLILSYVAPVQNIYRLEMKALYVSRPPHFKYWTNSLIVNTWCRFYCK